MAKLLNCCYGKNYFFNGWRLLNRGGVVVAVGSAASREKETDARTGDRRMEEKN